MMRTACDIGPRTSDAGTVVPEFVNVPYMLTGQSQSLGGIVHRDWSVELVSDPTRVFSDARLRTGYAIRSLNHDM